MGLNSNDSISEMLSRSVDNCKLTGTGDDDDEGENNDDDGGEEDGE